MRQIHPYFFCTGAYFIIGGIFSSLSNEYMGPVQFSKRLPFIKCIRLFVLVAISLFLNGNITAQNSQTKISFAQAPHPLSPGDQFPMELLQPYLHNKKPSLIILDFWATWCSSCLRAFPKLDSFQTKFNGNLQVILVNQKGTGDDPARIKAMFDKRQKKDGTKYDFISISKDTILSKYFPYNLLPHYVWLDYSGKVIAITSSDHITAHNIQNVLNKKTITLPQKKDQFDYKRSLPLLHNNNAGDISEIIFRSLLIGKLSGLGKSARIFKDSHAHKFTFINYPALDLAYRAYEFPLNLFQIDTLLYKELKTNIYSYELIAPPHLSKQDLMHIMAQDIKQYLGIAGYYKKMRTPCWVLQLKPGADTSKLKTKNKKPNISWKNKNNPFSLIINQPLSRLVGALNNPLLQMNDHPIVINETGILFNVDIKLYSDLENLHQLKKELDSLGLILQQTERELDFFIIKKTTHEPTNN